MRLSRETPLMPRLLLMALIICSVYLVTQLLFKENKPEERLFSNVNYINSAGFSIRADSTNQETSAKGTIFVEGKEGIADRISIVAAIDIDSNDWGGVSFYIPNHWKIVNVKSSYPENETRKNPSDNASIWSTTDTKSEWRTFVEIGRDRSYQPTGGGHGTVVIDLVYYGPDKALQKSVDFTVDVGSKTKDGIRIVGTDHVRVPVSMLK